MYNHLPPQTNRISQTSLSPTMRHQCSPLACLTRPLTPALYTTIPTLTLAFTGDL